MTKQQAREELEQAERIRMKIAVLRLRLRELQENASSLSSPQFDRAGGCTHSHDALERRVIRLMDKEKKIEAEILEDNIRLQEALKAITDKIMQTSGKVRLFLIKHYIEGRTMSEIGDEFGHIEPISVYKLKCRALEQYAAANDEQI